MTAAYAKERHQCGDTDYFYNKVFEEMMAETAA